MNRQSSLIGILLVIAVGIIWYLSDFERKAAEANQRAIIDDIHKIDGSAKAYYKRLSELGGGGRSFKGFKMDGSNPDSTRPHQNYRTPNADYEIIIVNDTQIEIIATGVERYENEDVQVRAMIRVHDLPEFTYKTFD